MILAETLLKGKHEDEAEKVMRAGFLGGRGNNDFSIACFLFWLQQAPLDLDGSCFG